MPIFYYLQNNNRCYSATGGSLRRLFSSFALLYFFIFCPTALFSQTNYQIQAKGLHADQVIRLLENELAVTFNFSHDILPGGQFSFSGQGTSEELIQLSFSILDRKIIMLDPGIYAIQQQSLSPEERIAPLSIQGQVVDANDVPLAGATIWIPALEKAFTSDGQGAFIIEGHFANAETIEFRYLGYETTSKSVATLRRSDRPKVVLIEQAHILGEVVVKDFLRWRSPLEEVAGDVLMPDKMMAMAGRVDQDVFSMVQLLPGLYSASESITDLQTRGGTPDQTDFAWNDIPLLQTSHFFGKISSINPFMVNRATIVRDGGSASHSGQASGSIRMQSKAQHIDSLSLRLHSNLLYSNIGLQFPILKDQLSLQVAWRQSYTQFFESIAYNRFFDQTFQFGKVVDEEFYREFYELTDLVTLTPRMSFGDLSANLNIHLTPKDFIKISGMCVNNFTRYVKSGEVLGSSPTDELSYTNTGASLSYQRRWSDQLNSALRWSKSQYNNDYLYLEDSDSIAITDETKQTNEVIQESLHFSNTFIQQYWELSGGIESRWLSSAIYYAGRNGTDIDVYYESSDTAQETNMFIQLLLKPFSWGQLESGWRWSSYSLIDEKFREPRFHLSLFPLPNWTVHAHLGWYHQVLNQRSLYTYLQPENGFWHLSNQKDTDFRPALRNRQFSTGLRYQKGGWNIGATVYRKQLDDMWTSALDFDILEDPYQFSSMNVRGTELSLQYDNSWFSLLWAYDYIKERLVLSDESELPSPFAQPHRLSLFQAVRWKKLTFSLHWKFASGRLFSIPEGLETYTDDFGDERFALYYEELLTEKNPNYHNLDLSLQYNLGKPSNKVFGRIGLSINNVYNRRNIIRNFYYVNYNTDPFQASLLSRQGLVFTPNLSIELFFNP